MNFFSLSSCDFRFQVLNLTGSITDRQYTSSCCTFCNIKLKYMFSANAAHFLWLAGKAEGKENNLINCEYLNRGALIHSESK